MLARSALVHLAAGVSKTSTHDLSRSARLVQRRLFSRNVLSLPSSPACSRVYRAALLESYRCYATAADGTKATPKVKRDVKKAAATKPVAKKPAVKKAVTKKAAPKKAPKKKAAAKKKPKKELTPEEQQRAQVKKEKQKVKKKEQAEKLLINGYKARALNPPVHSSLLNAWQIYAAEAMRNSPSDVKKALTDAGAKFKALTPAEKEHYNHLANESNAARQAEFTAWIRSHTPEEIRLANAARAWLRRKLTAPYARRKYFKLDDDRHLKRPSSAFTRFVKERFLSGDMKSIGSKEAIKLCADEWKALSASEQQKYKDEYHTAAVEYRAQFEQLYGHAINEKVPSP